MKRRTIVKISLVAFIWLFETTLVFGQQGTTQHSTKSKVIATKNYQAKQPTVKIPTFKEVEGLLVKNTCMVCHSTSKRQVGPSFVEISKRKYSNEKIYELIRKPQPQNWPEYSSQMPAMPNVPKVEALKMAAWINSLIR